MVLFLGGGGEGHLRLLLRAVMEGISYMNSRGQARAHLHCCVSLPLSDVTSTWKRSQEGGSVVNHLCIAYCT